MTTKQILFAIVMLSTIGNSALAMKKTKTDKVFQNGWDNQLNGIYLRFAILNLFETKLDHIKIIGKKETMGKSDKFLKMYTIGHLKKQDEGSYRAEALEYITSNYAIACYDGTIILHSTDPNDCEIVRNDYEELENEAFLRKKNTTK